MKRTVFGRLRPEKQKPEKPDRYRNMKLKQQEALIDEHNGQFRSFVTSGAENWRK